MPDDDLSSISGLDDRRRDVLAQKLGVSTCYELIMATVQRIVDAFGRRTIGPRSTKSSRVAGRGAPNPRRVDRCRRLGPRGLRMAVGGYLRRGVRERGQRETLERRIVVEQTESNPRHSPHSGGNGQGGRVTTPAGGCSNASAARPCGGAGPRRRPPGGRCPADAVPAEAGLRAPALPAPALRHRRSRHRQRRGSR